MIVKAEQVKAGDALADGFVVDAVYQNIGNRSALFALGRPHQYATKPAKRLLGFTPDALVQVR